MRRAGWIAILGLCAILCSSAVAVATEIVSVEWLDDGFILVTFDVFPPWNGWTMYVNGGTVPMDGEAGDVIVRPNDAPHRATGVFIGTDPWVSSLQDVEFPCEGTLQFRIPGAGLTNVYGFSLLDRGCCTASDCGGYKETLADWPEDVFNPQEESGIPYNPPVASLISFGEANALGETTVTGNAGAALPGGIVYAVNLSSTHQSYTTAAADGSFQLVLFAPPGSPVMIKHGSRAGPHAHRWHALEMGMAEGINPYPGTILHVPYETHASLAGIPFATAGGIEIFADDSAGSRNLVRSAWSLEGTMTSMMGADQPLHPYDTVQISGTLRLHSQAITGATDVRSIRVHINPMLLQIHDRQGNAVTARDNFMSTTLTPTGLPIQGGHGPAEWGTEPTIDITGLRVVEDGLIEGRLVVRFGIPGDLPPGLYRPVLWIEPENVPGGSEWTSAYVVRNTYSERQAPLPPIRVASYTTTAATSNRMIWRLLMDDIVLGTHGARAEEDDGAFALSSQIVTQGAPFIVPPVDVQTGLPIEYRLEPFLPTISFTDRRMPSPPLIPFELPGGGLSVSIKKPDGTVTDLGTSSFTQSFNRTKTTRSGVDLNDGTVQLEDVYSLMVDETSYRVTFDQYGLHTITMTGWVADIWGNRYEGGGTYGVWVAEWLDIDVGTLPGTPMGIGDAWNPMVTVHPRVPAEIEITVTQVPESDSSRSVAQTIQGTAGTFGTFAPDDSPVIAIDDGEYRVDLFAQYMDAGGVVYAGAMTWGGVIMTPSSEAQLIAHGRRGVDSLQYIPNHWFVVGRDLTFAGSVVTHTLNPYYNGDILWSGDRPDPVGASLVLGASVQDTVGLIAIAAQARAERQHVETYSPGDRTERFRNGEIPLFISTASGRSDKLFPDEIDQIAYSYAYSERPGVRVREVITEDDESGGYWRLNTLYDDQPGIGVLGDQPNDFKFQYVGTVFRDLQSGHSEYGGQGTGWIFIPEDDALGSRAMPPFAGPGNGGWTTEGGPIMTLDGEDVHIFIHPTGLRAGSILEVGDTVRFAGHIMPTLDSEVDVTITAPSGTEYTVNGQANSIGYFYDPSDDFVANEPGVWTADVRVWHDGACSGGATLPPYPSGDVLGSDGGRFTFYVVPKDTPKLLVTSPDPGYLRLDQHVIAPIRFRGTIAGADSIRYTTAIPGVILEQGTANVSASGSFAVTYDPASLHQRFPNLDLIGRDHHTTGLSDSVSIALVAVTADGTPVAAEAITIQGERIYIGNQGGE